jgi:hypothetical protein
MVTASSSTGASRAFPRLPRAPQRRDTHGSVHGTSGAFDLEISEACIQRIADRRGRLRRTAISLHPIVPGFTGSDVRDMARLSGTLPGALYRRPPDAFL